MSRARRHHRGPLRAVGAACLMLLVLGACSAKKRQKVLSLFIDGAGKPPPPPTQRVRRDLLREIEELKRELELARTAAERVETEVPEAGLLPAEQARTWPEVAELLPRDAAGNVDWIRSLEAGEIEPWSGLEPNAPPQATFELDVELKSSASPLYQVVFSHGVHTQWLTCANCHPAPFSLRRADEPARIDMSTINAGEHCGKCHGSVAFGTNACSRCHTAGPTAGAPPVDPERPPIERAGSWKEALELLPVTGGVPDWGEALERGVIAPRAGVAPSTEQGEILSLDIEMVPDEDVEFTALFSHEIHTAWVACESCHPAIFDPEAGANPVSMDEIYAGKYCGACHGTVVFGAEEPEACARCHPALAGE